MKEERNSINCAVWLIVPLPSLNTTFLGFLQSWNSATVITAVPHTSIPDTFKFLASPLIFNVIKLPIIVVAI